MAYFVKAEKRMEWNVVWALMAYFKNNAEIEHDNHGNITIHVAKGFDKIEDKLTPEECEQGICGGGLQEKLNGRTFVLKLE